MFLSLPKTIATFTRISRWEMVHRFVQANGRDKVAFFQLHDRHSPPLPPPSFSR